MEATTMICRSGTKNETWSFYRDEKGTASGNGTHSAFTFKNPISLRAGNNEIALLTLTIGLQGLSSRKVGATSLNSKSSISHIIFTFVIESWCKWLGKKQKRALLEALDKVKAELMILGFISLLLTFGQSYIVKICIPVKVANRMLPCPYKYEFTDDASSDEEEHRRKLLSYERRYLAADTSSYKCSREVHSISTRM